MRVASCQQAQVWRAYGSYQWLLAAACKRRVNYEESWFGFGKR